MLLKAQEIEQVTGCIVHFKIKPTWKNGREFSHNGEAFNVDFNSSSTSTAYLEDSAHVTPVKKETCNVIRNYRKKHLPTMQN